MRHIKTLASGDPQAQKAAQASKASAFTLIELLAILAVLGLLACVLAPGLARTAPNSTASQCQNNLRQLIGAWVMYAEDNNGKLVYNRDGGNAGRVAGLESWVAGWLDYQYATPDNTNTAMLVNQEIYRYGAYLGPYIKTPSPFKCPADRSVNRSVTRLPRVRSVSMNNRVGQGARSWQSPGAYFMYPTLSSISRPAPSQLFVLMDEMPESINDACFFTDPDTPWQLINYPTSTHSGGAGVAFADGRVEVHRWKDPRTMPLFLHGAVLNVNLPGDVDVQWLHEHAAAMR